MARVVFVMMKETGLSEDEVLAMPSERINSYLKVMKDYYKVDK